MPSHCVPCHELNWVYITMRLAIDEIMFQRIILFYSFIAITQRITTFAVMSFCFIRLFARSKFPYFSVSLPRIRTMFSSIVSLTFIVLPRGNSQREHDISFNFGLACANSNEPVHRFSWIRNEISIWTEAEKQLHTSSHMKKKSIKMQHRQRHVVRNVFLYDLIHTFASNIWNSSRQQIKTWTKSNSCLTVAFECVILIAKFMQRKELAGDQLERRRRRKKQRLDHIHLATSCATMFSCVFDVWSIKWFNRSEITLFLHSLNSLNWLSKSSVQWPK